MHIRKQIVRLPWPLLFIAILLAIEIAILALHTLPTPTLVPVPNPPPGTLQWQKDPCPACGGSGQVSAPAEWVKSHPEDTGKYPCWACGGSGTLLKEPANPAGTAPAGTATAAMSPSVGQVPAMLPSQDAGTIVLQLEFEVRDRPAASPPMPPAASKPQVTPAASKPQVTPAAKPTDPQPASRSRWRRWR